MAPLKYTPDQRIAAFWAKVNKRSGHWWNGTECWFWIASFGSSGYGQFYNGQRLAGAHCFAYTLAHGPIPRGQQVLHHCDNRACVRPDHLFEGNQAVNMADMWAKGRGYSHWRSHPPRVQAGQTFPTAKLTADDVRGIRTLRATGLTYRAIAQRYGVHWQTVGNVVSGKCHGHIEPLPHGVLQQT